MFKGFTLRFSDMKVGGKLAFGFGAAVLMAILVGAISYLATLAQASALAELRAEQQETRNDEYIRSELLEARRREKDFLLRWQIEGYDVAYDNYIVSNQQHVANILAAVAEARTGAELANETESVDRLNQIEEATKAYSAGVLDTTALIKERGFKDTGLEGQFRENVRAVETVLGASNEHLLVLLLQMRRNEKDYLLRGEEQYVTATHDLNTQFADAIQADPQLSDETKTELIPLVDAYIQRFDSLVSKDAAIAARTDEFRAAAQSIDPVVDALLATQTNREQAALESYQVAESTSRIAQIVLSVLAVITGTVLAIIISRMITRQLSEIDRLFRAAAVGDFNVRANILTRDELGQTAGGVNALLDQLTNLLRTAETERVSLEQALDTLVTTASSADVAEQAAQSAQEGSHAVEEAVSAMGRIRTSTQEAGRITKRLGEASQEINEIVAIIEDLSDRTTVLALNASIQAAAAGDAGRGFSVVAEEVQRLAERATGETRRIENLVKTIQSETNSAVVSIDEATREVVSGTQLAQRAGEQMSRLNGLVSQVANLIQVAATRTSEQTGVAIQSTADHSLMGGNGSASQN